MQIQHPRMDPRRFDQVVVTRHDGLTGPNVIVTRTALHRVTPQRLAAARLEWAGGWPTCRARWSRCWSAAATGASGWRQAEGAALAAQLAAMMRTDGAGVAVTPSRRTAPPWWTRCGRRWSRSAAGCGTATGENPYFGLLACADAIVVTADSVSMVSEAVATAAPVLIAELPGRSRRIGAFLDGLRGTAGCGPSEAGWRRGAPRRWTTRRRRPIPSAAAWGSDGPC